MIQSLLAGMFLFNSLPHLVMGISGQKHMTPLAKDSSAMVNVVWGFINVILGLFFLGFDPLMVVQGANLWGFLGGGLFMSLADAWLFSNPSARFPWFKS